MASSRFRATGAAWRGFGVRRLAAAFGAGACHGVPSSLLPAVPSGFALSDASRPFAAPFVVVSWPVWFDELRGIKVARLQPSAGQANGNASPNASEQPVYTQTLQKPDYGWPGGNAYLDFPGLLAGRQYAVTFSIQTMAESLPILGPRSLTLETSTLTVPNSSTSAQAWAVHHWVYDLNHGGTEAQSEGEGPGVVSALTVGWRNVDSSGNAAYNVYMQSNGQAIPLTDAPVTGNSVTLGGTNVATPRWCNQVPGGGGTASIAVMAINTSASTDVALPPGSCYDNASGIAWQYGWQYFATDHLGTVRAAYTVASDGTTSLQTFAYEPFGVEIPGSIPDVCDNTHKYTGQERDAETNNDYMHFRYYAAGMGRFLKPDNIFGSALNPQGFNLYSYVQGNPVNFNDPLGHDRPRPGPGQVNGNQIGGGFLDSTLGNDIVLSDYEAYQQMLDPQGMNMNSGAALVFSNAGEGMTNNMMSNYLGVSYVSGHYENLIGPAGTDENGEMILALYKAYIPSGWHVNWSVMKWWLLEAGSHAMHQDALGGLVAQYPYGHIQDSLSGDLGYARRSVAAYSMYQGVHALEEATAAVRTSIAAVEAEAEIQGVIGGTVTASSPIAIFAEAGMTTGAGCALVGGAFGVGVGIGLAFNELAPTSVTEGIGDFELWVIEGLGYQP